MKLAKNLVIFLEKLRNSYNKFFFAQKIDKIDF